MTHDFYYVAFLPGANMYLVEYDAKFGDRITMTNMIWKAETFETQSDAFEYMRGFDREYKLLLVRGVET